MNNEVIYSALAITGIVVLIILGLVLVYLIALVRRSHIVMKKIDYLVEDFTYKSESLNIAVDAIGKVSNYVLTFDSLTKKGISSLLKLVSQNRNFFYSFVDKMKKNINKPTRIQEAKKTETKSSKTISKPVVKKAINKTNKPTPKNNTTKGNKK